ncbi:MAG: hypothetical protein RJQ07_01105 [Pseudomonadales bacterium]
MPDLIEKIVICHDRLRTADIPHAFGGALALAWCTHAARGTIDIDINLFVGADRIDAVLEALPEGVSWNETDYARLQRDLQQRLWWEHTPLDLFFSSTDYHDQLPARVRWETFADRSVPFLSCLDLAVFKVFFNRTKDWADLEAMREADTLDINFVAGVITEYLGADDERLAKLLDLRSIAPSA